MIRIRHSDFTKFRQVPSLESAGPGRILIGLGNGLVSRLILLVTRSLTYWVVAVDEANRYKEVQRRLYWCRSRESEIEFPVTYTDLTFLRTQESPDFGVRLSQIYDEFPDDPDLIDRSIKIVGKR